MGKKTISNTFTVNTIIDGESAPYYFQEWFAWSNDPSTSNVTTPPTIGGSWETSIPAQGSYAYLWRKSIRYVWNESTRQYIGDAAQYVRMTGTNGTSIKTRGQVADASSRGNGTATIITDSGTQTITLSDGDAVTQLDNGHLYQWVTEGGGKWLDLGQFKGESGVTYYTHIAWATKVNYNSSGEVTSVEGFTPDKSPNDTTHIWMGTYVDTNSGQDSANASLYTWSNTKGSAAVQYYIKTDIDNVVVPSDRQSIDLSSTPKAYFKKITGSEEAAQTMYYATYWRSGSALTSRTSGQASQINLATTYNSIYDSLVIFAKVDSAPTTTDFDCKKEIIVQKRGNTGGRGKVGRFFYFGGVFNSEDESQTFIVNDAQAPYFEHTETITTQSGTTTIKGYHVFNYDTNGTYTMYQMWTISSNWNNKPWELMTDDFKYIITEALFGAYAHFGGAIINGDFMLSQYGTINGVESTTYTSFDADHPNDNTGSNFIPYYCVNLRTGETYQNKAVVRGVINATAIYQKYQNDVAQEETIDPSKGSAIVIPNSYIGNNIYLPSASSYDYLTLTFYRYFPASTLQTIARICASGNDLIYTNTELKPTVGQYRTYCKSFYPAHNLVIKLHSIGGQWCLDCDESKLLAFYDENGNQLEVVK